MAHQINFRYRHFTILKDQILGHGYYGAVYKARCDQLTCAAKILHPVLVDPYDPGSGKILQVERFQQECDFLNRIRHPNIVQYLGVCQDPESSLPVLLMELLDSSLTKMLERSPHPIPYHIQVDLCSDVSLAVAYLHSSGIIHRDLSGNNVLVIAGRRAKVTDLMSSSILSSKELHIKWPGSLGYMSPESLIDPPRYTEKLDVFSQGVIMVQVCTRKFPNPGPAMKEIDDPRFPLGSVVVPVLEAERRKKHIDLIDPTHPLLPIALGCLEYRERDRPSAEELCQRLAALKESQEYIESSQHTTPVTPEVNETLQQERDELARQVEEKTREIATKDEQIAEYQRDIATKDHQIASHQQEIQTKTSDLSAKNDLIVAKDCEVQRLQVQLHELNQRLVGFQETNQQLQGQISDLQKLQQQPDMLPNTQSKLFHATTATGDELAPYRLDFQDPLPANRQVGSGCYGTVYAVEIDGVQCIAKRVQDILLGERGQEGVGQDERRAIEEKFRQECILLSKIRHPNIVQFMGVRYDRDMYDLTLVMERLPMDLQKCLERCHANNLFIPLSIKFSILVDVTYGLLHLHNRSILHRDLTAGNILLTSNLRAKIADLGVSRIFQSRYSQKLSKIPGTIGYMPPEALKDNPEYNLRLDIFSFGVLALFVCVQEFPEFSWQNVPDYIVAKGESELYKRKKWIDKIGERHILYPLIHQCLQDISTARPSTMELNAMIKKLGAKFPRQFQDINKMIERLCKLGMSDILI